jgi:hypothetical protein
MTTAGLWLLGLCGINAQNLVTNGNFSTGDLTGWSTTISITTPANPTTITYDSTKGNPVGSALLARNEVLNAPNANYLYQVIPVVVGQKYKLSADWAGDLLNGNTGRNWAEVYVNFAATAEALDLKTAVPQAPGIIYYKKATDGANSTNPITTTPYVQPWTWEDITKSPTSATVGPVDGAFTATGAFMLIAFNVGGRDASRNAGPAYYNVDNVSLTFVPSDPPIVTSVAIVGADIVIQGSKGTPLGTYEMLRSADLTKPVETWANIGSGTFDTSGNFSFTSTRPGTPATNPSSFYRLRTVPTAP